MKTHSVPTIIKRCLAVVVLLVLPGIILLVFSISSVSAMAAEKKSEAAAEKSRVSAGGKSQASLCKEISKVIKDGTIDKHMPEYQAPSGPDPRGADYLNLDIDGDGIPDKVTVSSGSESSYLEVQLSSGGAYDLDEGGFIRIVKIRKGSGLLLTHVAYRSLGVMTLRCEPRSDLLPLLTRPLLWRKSLQEPEPWRDMRKCGDFEGSL